MEAARTLMRGGSRVSRGACEEFPPECARQLLDDPEQAVAVVSNGIHAREAGLVGNLDAICFKVHRRIPMGYPTPLLGRDLIVDPVLRRFEEHGICSRGRFGAWKYEVSNQDHSFAQGYEWAERMTGDGGEQAEPTMFHPGLVNSRRNP